MPSEALMNLITAAIVVSAVALLFQTLMLYGMFRSVRALRRQVTEFLPKAEEFVVSTQRSMSESRREIQEVTSKATAVLDSTQRQLERVDDLLGDATTRAKAQLERVELVVEDTVSRVHRTVVELNEGILRPIRELNGLAIGLRVALQTLLRGGRPTVAQATSDEEMFI
jgi:hypothetical protein